MKVPLSWLREFVSVKASAEEIARRLTFAGLEVEGIEKTAGDSVIEVNVTPNRGDGLSVLGIAREVGALFGLGLKNPSIPPSSKEAPFGVKKGGKGGFPVSVAKPQACPHYMLAVIEGVKIGPSPTWLVQRLEACGVRPINNVVDVTNYVLMGYGQPLHAFDRKKIRGGRVIVRTAKAGEKIKTLDGQDRELQATDLVIADAEGAVALAGVMGGKDSEVDDKTTSIALECAFFDPSWIRSTARRLGLQTESSYRFERRVDPEGLPAALAAAVRLISELASGRLVGPVVDLRKTVGRAADVILSAADVNRTLGTDWVAGKIQKALTRLSFQVKKKGSRWAVTPPSWRGDAMRAVDVIEEAARIIGYENIPTVFPPLTSAGPREDAGLALRRRVKAVLVDLGLRETIHYSFEGPTPLGPGDDVPVKLANPLSPAFGFLRTSLLPYLIGAVAYHHNHKIPNVRLFELRKVFKFEKDSGRIEERRKLAGALSGARSSSHWSGGTGEADFYDAKGVVERILDVCGVTARFELGPFDKMFHPQRQAQILVDGQPLGIVGELHPDLVTAYLKKAAYFFELDWEALAALAEGQKVIYRDFSRTPIVERDLALVLDEAVTAGAVQDYLSAGDSSVQSVTVFDVYRGQPIPVGKKSLAFSIKIGRPDRTLTEEQVNEIYGLLVEGVKKSFNAEIRT